MNYIDHIKLREGHRTRVYLDTLGYPTAGYGHLLTKEEQEIYPVGAKIPSEVILNWLEKDLQKALMAARTQAMELDIESQDFIDALVSVNFQLGSSWYKKFPSCFKALKERDLPRAVSEVYFASPSVSNRLSNWYKQTPVRVEDFVKAILDIKE